MPVTNRLLAAADPELAPGTALADARTAVAAARVGPGAEAHRRAVLDFVEAHPDALHRSCVEGHLTGSALVVDAAGERVVMLHHRKLQRWLQPGGHCDGDANLAAVALREAEEETGLTGLQVLVPAVDVDVHRVEPPGEPPHLHLDVRFAVVAPRGAELAGNHESTAIRWVAFDGLADLGVDEGTLRLAAAARAALAAERP